MGTDRPHRTTLGGKQGVPQFGPVGLALVLAVGLGTTVVSCGGGGPSAAIRSASAPAPSISSLAPDSVMLGAVAQTITINGDNFLPTSTVMFGGVAEPVSVVSSSEITMVLSSEDLSHAGISSVVVSNGDSETASASFTVENPAPAVSSISPTSAFPCDGPATVTVEGTNFISGSGVTYGGAPVAASVVSATQITLSLDEAQTATPGPEAIVVTNPGPGGGLSNPVVLTVDRPAGPALSGTTEMDAVVKAYAVNSDNSNAGLLCTSASDGQGNFDLTLSAPVAGGVRIVSSQGQVAYDGTTVTDYPQTSPDSAYFDSVNGDISGIDLDPISTLVDTAATAYLGGGNTDAQAHALAANHFTVYFDFSQSSEPTLQPSQESDQNQRLAVVQGLLTEGLGLAPNSPDDIFAALDQDAADVRFDGWDGSTRVMLDGAPLPVTAGTNDYLAAMMRWTEGPGKSLLSGSPVAALIKGVTGDATFGLPASAGLSATSSGAIATFAWQGRQYLIINDGDAGGRTPVGIVVVDITDPTAAKPAVKVWPFADLGNLFSGGVTDSAGGIAVVGGGTGHLQAFVYDGGPDVALLNVGTLIDGTPGTDDPVDFSGVATVNGSEVAKLAGAVWDGCWLGCKLELGTPGAYVTFDLTSDALDGSTLIPIQDQSESVAEDLAGDIPYEASQYGSEEFALAGNAGGLELLDYSGSKPVAYYLSDSEFAQYFPSFPSSAAGAGTVIADNAMDLGYETGVITPGPQAAASVVGFFDLSNVSEYSSGGPVNLPTFTMAEGTYAEEALSTSMKLSFSSVAVDSDSHSVVFQAVGNSPWIAVGTLQNTGGLGSGGNGAVYTGLDDWVLLNLSAVNGLAAFTNQADPPGAVAVTSLGAGAVKTGGISYAYLLDAGGRAVVQVDVNGLMAMPRQGPPGSGDAAHEQVGDPAAATDALTGAAVVREISW